MSIDSGQFLILWGLEYKLVLELWLYLLVCEALVPQPWMSLLCFKIPGIPYDLKLHFSILAL